MSRSSGVAPVTVWFDATLVTSTATTKPLHHIEYRWDFNDPGTSWGTTGLSTNTATGPMAAHVFRNVGTFTPTLTAFDGTNTASCTMTVTVSDPDTTFSGTNTVCVANATATQGAGGCPSGALTPAGTTSFVTAMSHAASGKRVLLKRGDTFTIAGGSGGASLSANGPGIIGAYGSGALPIVNATGNFSSNAVINIGNASPATSDWRIMDLQINGSGSSNAAGISVISNANRITMSGLNISGFALQGLVLSEFVGDFVSGYVIWSQMALVDSALSNMATHLVYGASERFAIMGNTMLTSTGSHVFRTQYFTKGVFSNNIVRNSAAGLHVLKFGAPCFTNSGACAGNFAGQFAGLFTEKAVISDNVFSTILGNWMTAIGPENDTLDERVRDIIVERNMFQVGVGGSGVTTALINFGSNVTIRNNLIDMTNGDTDSTPLIVQQRLPGGAAPIPTGNEIYNNSIYKPSAGSIQAISVESPATGTIVKNNLVYAPSSTVSRVVLGGSGAVTPGGNSTNAEAATSPNWLATPPCPSSPPTLCSPLNWKVQAGSYTITHGVAVPVWRDALDAVQPTTRTTGATNP